MSSPPILIIGAGPSGLVLALRLRMQGVDVRIVDGKSGPGQASRAMVVQARTLELYQQMGIADEVITQGIQINAVHMRVAGRQVVRIPLHEVGKGVSPFPFALCYAQDDHECFLVGKLQELGVTVEWNTSLQDFSQEVGGVQVRLLKNGRQETSTCQYICGCDGAHSRVREVLELDFPGGTYQQPFFVADVQVDGETTSDLVVTFSQQDLGLILPVRRSGMHRLIGTVPLELRDRCDLTFEDVREHVRTLQGISIATVNWFSEYRVHHRVADRFRVGRAFLVGDAGHVHSPAGGQGMNTGIGDAVNLAWKLAGVVHGHTGVAILDTYETERIAFARALVATTDRLFSSMVEQGRAMQILRTWMLPRLLKWLTGFKAVQRLVFKVVSQVRLQYRSSALSAGRAGLVHGGDRMPWIMTQHGSTFDSLRWMTWRVQVFGLGDAAFLETCALLHLPVDVFPWTKAASQAGVMQGAAYVLRPDGYVALALERQKGQILRDWWLTWEFNLDKRSGSSPVM